MIWNAWMYESDLRRTCAACASLEAGRRRGLPSRQGSAGLISAILSAARATRRSPSSTSLQRPSASGWANCWIRCLTFAKAHRRESFVSSGLTLFGAELPNRCGPDASAMACARHATQRCREPTRIAVHRCRTRRHCAVFATHRRTGGTERSERGCRATRPSSGVFRVE